MPGTVIKMLRQRKQMTQQEVATQMGISQAAYSKIENNITELTVRHCRMLSRIFGENLYEYLDESIEVNPRGTLKYRYRPLAQVASQVS